MKPVRMNKGDLIVKLKENREKHRVDFEHAVDAYRKQALKAIRALTKQVKVATREELAKLYLGVSLTSPKQFLQEYDRAIAMFENTLDDVIELTQQEFTTYVLDEWAWSDMFIGSTAMYNSSRK